MRLHRSVQTFVLLLLYVFVQHTISSISKARTLRLAIPWPSGIQIDKVAGTHGTVYRFGRLQFNSLQLRPGYEQVHSVQAVLSDSECADIVQRSESYASKFGWSKGRHVDYEIRPTKDLPVEVIFENEIQLDLLYERFGKRLWPTFAYRYGINATQIRLTDLFVTKYDASSAVERQLAPHMDKSPWSFVISLNTGFVGGGTIFYPNSAQWKTGVGDALVFHGYQLHGAVEITSGVRYIMAGFCEYGEEFPFESEAAHAAFMLSYDPKFDGYAAQAGFRSGDLIVGIEVCEVGDADTTQATVVLRKKMEVTGATMDKEWIAWAKSCEELDPGSDTVLWVRRKHGTL